MKGIKVDSCWNCPIFNFCEYGLRILSEKTMPIKCPLPNWPSAITYEVADIQDLVFDCGLASVKGHNKLIEWLKSKNMEIFDARRDEK